MYRLLIVIVFFFIELQAMTFSEAIDALNRHESVESIVFKLNATKEEANFEGSWGDPKFKVAAKNFPKDTLSDNQSPMTGVELSLSQKIPLTSKYESKKHAYDALSQAYHFDAKDKKEKLAKALWEVVILKKQTLRELNILQDNTIWIEKILKVSKRLYATGKVSQQAILEIEIRKSELERDISNKNFERTQIDDKLTYLIGNSGIEDETIPWHVLDKHFKVNTDYRELSLQKKLKVKEHSLKASKQNYIPDLTVSLGYTKRSDVDPYGDFVSASVSLYLPFSDQKSSKYAVALQEKFRVQKNYEAYKRAKRRDVSILSHEISKLTREIEILTNKMIKFATNARKITSKSYNTGNSSYVELLQSELKLQKILMQKVRLQAKRAIQRVTLKYIKGEALYE